MEFKKLNLADDAIENIPWRRVRDAFKKIGLDGFHEITLGGWLFREEILDAIAKIMADRVGGDPQEILKNRGYSIKDVRDLLELTESYWLSHILYHHLILLRKQTPILLAKLIEEGYVELCEYQGDRFVLWQLSEKGHSLRMQKALRRISRTRGEELLQKVICAAEAFNKTKGPNYHIVSIWVYGSYIKGKETLGDVDLVVNLQRRKAILKKVKSWVDCEMRRAEEIGLSIENKYWITTEREAIKHLRVSPYVSINTDTTWLESLEERNEPYKLVWSKD